MQQSTMWTKTGQRWFYMKQNRVYTFTYPHAFKHQNKWVQCSSPGDLWWRRWKVTSVGISTRLLGSSWTGSQVLLSDLLRVDSVIFCFLILLHPWLSICFSVLIWVFYGSKPVLFFLSSLLEGSGLLARPSFCSLCKLSSGWEGSGKPHTDLLAPWWPAGWGAICTYHSALLSRVPTLR